LKQMRFDWNGGNYSFWLNDDMTGEGQVPPQLKDDLEKRGIKIKQRNNET